MAETSRFTYEEIASGLQEPEPLKDAIASVYSMKCNRIHSRNSRKKYWRKPMPNRRLKLVQLATSSPASGVLGTLPVAISSGHFCAPVSLLVTDGFDLNYKPHRRARQLQSNSSFFYLGTALQLMTHYQQGLAFYGQKNHKAPAHR